jgi:hypothetical protein
VPVRVDFGTAPMTVSSFCPPLKIITVGIERMPYSVATLGLSSVFSFTWFLKGYEVSMERLDLLVRTLSICEAGEKTPKDPSKGNLISKKM